MPISGCGNAARGMAQVRVGDEAQACGNHVEQPAMSC
jgi:hypothetical protein